MTEGATGTPPDLAKLAQELERGVMLRIQALEQENRQLRRYTTLGLVVAGILAGLAAVLLVVSARNGFSGSAADVVQARRFVLRDANGVVRGIWGIEKTGELQFVLRDAKSRPRVRVMLLDGGASGLTLSDSAQHTRAVLALLPDETTTLTFADGSGQTRTVLGANADGASTIVFADREGNTRAGMGVDKAGTGTFTLLDRNGTQTGGDSSGQ